MQPERDYEVGYGKPPLHTRFKTGQSGNPRGRPRGSKSLATLVGEALDQKVVVTDGGSRRKISKREAMITQLVNRSAQADLKAMQLLLGIMQDIERRSETRSPPTAFTEADQEILKLIESRLVGGDKGDDANV
jgi:Family of unknown function (DUF5681)